MTETYYLFIGSYCPKSMDGIHLYRLDEAMNMERISGISGVDNPSFLAVDSSRTKLFAVSETANGGAVVALRADRTTGEMNEVNRMPSFGDYPCHLTIDSTGEWLLLVNYMSGSVCVYPIGKDGALGPISDQAFHSGRSIRPDRQEAPHPHAVYQIPGTPYYLVPDLGTDTVYLYFLDRQEGKLISRNETKVNSGSGPRHLAFHPHKPVVYVIEELSSTITAFSMDTIRFSLQPLQTISTLPDGFAGSSTCAEIAVSPCGNYVYGSNRGHDSVASFRVLEDGTLEPLGHTGTAGQTPRNFTLLPDGRYLLTANQDSDSVVLMKVNDEGIPELTGRTIRVGRPVCLKIMT